MTAPLHLSFDVACSAEHAFRYLWHLARDRADATQVEITFASVGPTATRVEIVHRGWDRIGDAARWRERNHAGWNSLLPHYRSALVEEGIG